MLEARLRAGHKEVIRVPGRSPVYFYWEPRADQVPVPGYERTTHTVARHVFVIEQNNAAATYDHFETAWDVFDEELKQSAIEIALAMLGVKDE